jgi:hypothetical protein
MFSWNYFLTFCFAALIIFFHHPVSAVDYFLLGLGISGTIIFFKGFLKE